MQQNVVSSLFAAHPSRRPPLAGSSGWGLVSRRNLRASWWGAPLAARLEP